MGYLYRYIPAEIKGLLYDILNSSVLSLKQKYVFRSFEINQIFYFPPTLSRAFIDLPHLNIILYTLARFKIAEEAIIKATKVISLICKINLIHNNLILLSVTLEH